MAINSIEKLIKKIKKLILLFKINVIDKCIKTNVLKYLLLSINIIIFIIFAIILQPFNILYWGWFWRVICLFFISPVYVLHYILSVMFTYGAYFVSIRPLFIFLYEKLLDLIKWFTLDKDTESDSKKTIILDEDIISIISSYNKKNSYEMYNDILGKIPESIKQAIASVKSWLEPVAPFIIFISSILGTILLYLLTGLITWAGNWGNYWVSFRYSTTSIVGLLISLIITDFIIYIIYRFNRYCLYPNLKRFINNESIKKMVNEIKIESKTI